MPKGPFPWLLSYFDASCSFLMGYSRRKQLLAQTLPPLPSPILCFPGKGARALKKKALTDMLRALSGIGLSRHRRAVPQGDREVSAWFRLPLPQDGAIHPDGCSLGTWADAGERD